MSRDDATTGNTEPSSTTFEPASTLPDGLSELLLVIMVAGIVFLFIQAHCSSF